MALLNIERVRFGEMEPEAERWGARVEQSGVALPEKAVESTAYILGSRGREVDYFNSVTARKQWLYII